MPSERRRQGGGEDDSQGVRLQKVLAAAGVGSRRACEELISQRRVTVNGKVAVLGQRVDPGADAIHVDGDRIPTAPGVIVLALNKPEGVVSTMSDPDGRPCVGDYVQDRPERLFHVGRLDVDTNGLILLTNDGELANRITHPSHELPKTYLVWIPGPVPRNLGKQLKTGVELEDGMARVDSFKLVQDLPGEAMVEIVLHDGRNRIVRRLMEAVGHPVRQLVRTRIGPIVLGMQRPGTVRVIHGAELSSLYNAVGL